MTALRCTAVLGIVLALTACGGGGDGAESGSTSSSSTSSTTSVQLSLSGTPATSVVAGNAYSYQPKVTESSGTVSFSITGQPSWATFDPATGNLSGTPTTANEGTTGAITITASDGGTTASIGPFTIDVTAPATSPTTTGTATLTWSAPTENTNGTALTDLAGYTIRYGNAADALTTSINVPASTTSFEVSNLAPGTYYFEVIAYASDGTQSSPSNVGSKTI